MPASCHSIGAMECRPAESATISAVEVEKCTTCGKPTVNPLVKMGIIDESMADILQPPPSPPPPKRRRRKDKCPEARLITAGPRTETSPVDPEPLNVNEDRILCAVCMTDHDGHWVGCDRLGCNTWYHQTCLPERELKAALLSISRNCEWLCNKCGQEE